MNQNTSPASSWKNIVVLSRILVVSSALLLIVSLIISGGKSHNAGNAAQHKLLLLSSLAVISFILLLAGRSYYNKCIIAVHRGTYNLQEKLTLLKKAFIRYWLYAQIALLAGVVLFIYTQDFTYLVFCAIICGFMAPMMPGISRLQTLLKLNDEEMKLLGK